MGRRYRVIKGLEINGRRVEAGSAGVTIPDDDVSWLLECGAIELDTAPDQPKPAESNAKPLSSGGRTERKETTP